MDAAMAHRERKQLNFSTIVDFSLSKQGIFFVTLRQQPVTKKMSQAFFFAVSSKISDFANQFLNMVLQCCPTVFGQFAHLDAHFFFRFLEFGRGRGNFFEKTQNKSCYFQNVFNFLAADFSLDAGIFCFSRQFSVCFQVFYFNRKKEHWVGKPSFLIGWLSNIRRLLTFAENAIKRYALCRKMKIVIRNLIYSVSGFLLL